MDASLSIQISLKDLRILYDVFIHNGSIKNIAGRNKSVVETNDVCMKPAIGGMKTKTLLTELLCDLYISR